MKRVTKKLLALVMTLAFLLQAVAVGAAEVPQTPVSTPAPVPTPKSAFTDVTTNDGNFIFINYLSKRGLLNGFPDGTFRPAAGLTRAEAAAALVKAAGLKVSSAKAVFKDVGPKYWAAASIAAAKDARLLSGYPDGTFRPEAKLTRAEGITLILKLSKQPDPGVELPVLADVATKHWAARPIAIGLASEMVGLTSDKKRFLPDTSLTRGSLARALAVLLTKDPALYETNLTDKLTVVTGPVTVTRVGSKISETITGSTELLPGDMVNTGTSGVADISFPDGTGLRLEKDSRFILKEARGRSYIKPDGTPGTSIEWLAVDLKSGKMFGALATGAQANDNNSSGKSAAIQARAMGLGNSSENRVRTAAAAAKPLPWWQQSGTKRTKVKVDMPTGVAAIRGTFWENTVNRDGSFATTLLTGSAEITAGGQTVGLAAGQRTEVTGTGAPPAPPAPLTAADNLEWARQRTWALERAAEMQTQQEQTLPPPPPAENPEQPAPPQNTTPGQNTTPTAPDITKIIGEAYDRMPPEQSSANNDNGGGQDNTAVQSPTVSSYPANGAVNVPTYLNEIRISYNKNVLDNGLYNGFNNVITLSTVESSEYVFGHVQGSMLFVNISTLKPGTTYTLTVPEGALKDDQGNEIPAYSFSFTTGEDVVTTVTGTVFDPQGLALPADDAVGTVRLYSVYGEGSDLPMYTLDGSTSFQLDGVRLGDYILKVETTGGQYTNSRAVPLQITGNQPVDKAVYLTNPMVIGQVYNPDGSIPTNLSNAVAYISPVNLNCEEITPINSDGTFRFGGVPTGRYRIRVESSMTDNNYTDSLPMEVDLVEGIAATQNIFLTNPTVTGTVYDSNDNIVQNALLKISSINADFPVKYIVTQSDGSFSIGGLPTGYYKIEASYDSGYPEYVLNTTEVTVEVAEGVHQVANIIFPNMVTVSGTVYTPAGEPYSSYTPEGSYVWINLEDDNGNSGSGSVDELGNFSIKVPTTGTYKLSAKVSDSVYTDPMPLDDVNVYEGMAPVTFSLTTPEISGKILNPDGSPFVLDSYTEVLVYSGDNFIKQVMVNSDGTFKIGGLPTGDYEIYTSGGNGQYTDSLPVNVHVTDGTLQNLNLTLTRPMISGKVTMTDSQFIPKGTELAVELYDSNYKRVAEYKIGDDGSFKFGPVSNGTYNLVVVPYGDNPFAGGASTTVQVSGTPVTSDLSLTSAQISGKVLTPGGNLLSSELSQWGYVIIKNEGGQVVGQVRLGDTSTFKIGMLSPGNYTLQVLMDQISSYADSDVSPLITVTGEGPIIIQDLIVTPIAT